MRRDWKNAEVEWLGKQKTTGKKGVRGGKARRDTEFERHEVSRRSRGTKENRGREARRESEVER
jgi:hypothetical protein